jgi:hypothetical protein
MRPYRLSTLPAACAAVALAALAAGCATQQSSADAYDHQLARWQGASEESLVAAWGKPLAVETVEGGKVMVYVNNHVAAYDNRPTFSFGIGGWGMGGGNSSVGAGVGVTTPVGSANANSCVTRFLVHDGKIESWTFEGAGCGASAL